MQQLIRTVKLQLYPTAQQRTAIQQHIDTNRYVYNHCLAKKIQAYETSQLSISKYKLITELTQLKQDPEYGWLSDTHSQTMQQTILKLDLAYQSFFRRLKKGGVPGFPKFKSRKSTVQSFSYPQGTKYNTNNTKLYLPKIGYVSIRGYRELLTTIRTVTIIVYNDGLIEAAVTGVCENQTTPNINFSTIGLDVGTNKFVTDSNGNKVLPLDLRQQITKIKHLQHKLCNCTRGSNNKNRIRVRIARLHRKIVNRRRNFVHHVANMYTGYRVVYIEDLNIKSMVASTVGSVDKPNYTSKQKSRLNNLMSQQAWGEFFTILEYKLSERNSGVYKINPAYTSQRCSSCGHIDKQSRHQEDYNCTSCGYQDDADVNAAKNIEELGKLEFTVTVK